MSDGGWCSCRQPELNGSSSRLGTILDRDTDFLDLLGGFTFHRPGRVQCNRRQFVSQDDSELVKWWCLHKLVRQDALRIRGCRYLATGTSSNVRQLNEVLSSRSIDGVAENACFFQLTV